MPCPTMKNCFIIRNLITNERTEELGNEVTSDRSSLVILMLEHVGKIDMLLKAVI